MRDGDPVLGGATRSPIMTAYRQQALIRASALQQGLTRPLDTKTWAPQAGRILLDNVYGWFDRQGKGVYALNEAGEAALLRWPQTVVFGEDGGVPLDALPLDANINSR